MGQSYDCDGEIVNNKDTIKDCWEHGTKIRRR